MPPIYFEMPLDFSQWGQKLLPKKYVNVLPCVHRNQKHNLDAINLTLSVWNMTMLHRAPTERASALSCQSQLIFPGCHGWESSCTPVAFCDSGLPFRNIRAHVHTSLRRNTTPHNVRVFPTLLGDTRLKNCGKRREEKRKPSWKQTKCVKLKSVPLSQPHWKKQRGGRKLKEMLRQQQSVWRETEERKQVVSGSWQVMFEDQQIVSWFSLEEELTFICKWTWGASTK